MKFSKLHVAVIFILVVFLIVLGNRGDSYVKADKKNEKTTETLLCIGSESMSSLVWELMSQFKEFNNKQLNTNLRSFNKNGAVTANEIIIELESQGSSSVPVSMLKNTAQLGAMSRQMTPNEKKVFREKYGVEPLEIVIAVDSVVFFVNPVNPVDCLRSEQLSEIYSAKEHSSDLFWEKYTNIGCSNYIPRKKTDSLQSDEDNLHSQMRTNRREINLYGRNSVSGTASFVKETILKGKSFSPYMNELPSTGSIVFSVANDISGIGFGSKNRDMLGVKIIKIIQSQPQKSLDSSSIKQYKEYSFERYFYLYINRYHELKSNSPIIRFLNYVQSEDGAKIINMNGFSVPDTILKNQQIRKISAVSK